MSRFGDLVKGVATESAPAVVETPAPEPVKEVLTEASPLEEMNKKQLEDYGRTIGIELDRRHSKDKLIQELNEFEDDQ